MFCDFTGPGLYFYLESSYPRIKGSISIMTSPYILSTHNCLSFKYHMYGANIATLKVRVDSLASYSKVVWRLAGNQGNGWKMGQVLIDGVNSFKVILSMLLI